MSSSQAFIPPPLSSSSLESLQSTAPISPPTHGHFLRDPVLLRDAIIGFSDGLTVPFALTASLSSLGNSKLVIIGGLAELFAGAISMGLGAGLASVTERKRFEIMEAKEKARWLQNERVGPDGSMDSPEKMTLQHDTEQGGYSTDHLHHSTPEQEIRGILDKYGVRTRDIAPLAERLRSNDEM